MIFRHTDHLAAFFAALLPGFSRRWESLKQMPRALWMALAIALSLMGAGTATAAALSQATVNGAGLTLTFDEALNDTSVPDPSVFTVTANGSPVSVLNVGIAASDVTLTLASPVNANDIVLVDYTPSGTNDLTSTLGTAVSSFSSQQALNATQGMQPPVLPGPAMVNGAELLLAFSEPLSDYAPVDTNVFTVAVGGTPVPVAAAAISGPNLTLTLASAVTAADTVAVSYASNAGYTLQSISGTLVDHFADHFVANMTAPVATGARVDGATLTLSLNADIYTADLPPASDFTVSLAGAAATVTAVQLSGRDVILTIDPAAQHGQEALLGYIGLANASTGILPPLSSLGGGPLVDFADFAVQNDTAASSPPGSAGGSGTGGGVAGIVLSGNAAASVGSGDNQSVTLGSGNGTPTISLATDSSVEINQAGNGQTKIEAAEDTKVSFAKSEKDGQEILVPTIDNGKATVTATQAGQILFKTTDATLVAKGWGSAAHIEVNENGSVLVKMMSDLIILPETEFPAGKKTDYSLAKDVVAEVEKNKETSVAITAKEDSTIVLDKGIPEVKKGTVEVATAKAGEPLAKVGEESTVYSPCDAVASKTGNRTYFSNQSAKVEISVPLIRVASGAIEVTNGAGTVEIPNGQWVTVIDSSMPTPPRFYTSVSMERMDGVAAAAAAPLIIAAVDSSEDAPAAPASHSATPAPVCGGNRMAAESRLTAMYPGESAEFTRQGRLQLIRLGSAGRNQNLPGDAMKLSGFGQTRTFLKADITRLDGSSSRLKKDVAAAMLDALNRGIGNALAYQSQGQTGATGVWALKAQNSLAGNDSLAVWPVGDIVADTGPDSVSIAGNGLAQVRTGNLRATFAPAILDPQSFAAEVAKSGASELIFQPDGTLHAIFGNQVYVAQPDWEVRPGTGEGFAVDNLGRVVWTDSQGNAQALDPAFADLGRLQAVFLAEDPGFVLQYAWRGSVGVLYRGVPMRFTPDSIMAPAPEAHKNDAWWTDGNKAYIHYPDYQYGGRKGFAQGFTMTQP